MTDERPQVRYVTAALILDEKRRSIYLVKRAREPFQGNWAFPSGVGFSRYEDDPKIAVVKEVEGDLQCRFCIDGLVLEIPADIPSNPLPTYFYYGSIIGEPTPNQRFVIEAKWFPFREARNQQLAFEHNKVLEELVTKTLNQTNI